MKAAVIIPGETSPVYADMPLPVAKAGEWLVSVKAVALKHFDKSRSAGKHYSAAADLTGAQVIGGDGVCLLENGDRVYGLGITGMLAEQALIDKRRMAAVPHQLDDATAAALPNAVIGSAMALLYRARIAKGDAVLINGATGFTGRIAVQLALHYGAGKIIVTGRNRHSLNELIQLGAHSFIELTEDDTFSSAIREAHQQTPFNIVIDYLWGRPAETILSCLKRDGSFRMPVRYVSVGSVAGDRLSLSAAVLRSIDIQLTGSGLGAWTREQVDLLFSELLPEAFALAVAGKLTVETIITPFSAIHDAWKLEIPGGKRLVAII